MPGVLDTEPLLEAQDIQGNILRGFGTDYLDLVGLKIDEREGARSWLAGLVPRLASLAEVHDYRLRRTNGDPDTATEVLVNVALSRFGLEALGFDYSAIGEGLFNLSMGKLAASLGDKVVEDRPVDYVVGQDKEHTPDILFLIGCQHEPALDAFRAAWRTETRGAGLREIYRDRGHLLEGELEHFGYRDGISQVGVRGLLPGDPPQVLTPREIDPADPHVELFARPGQPLVWPGQFVFGYPTQDEEDPLRPGEARECPIWMRNGSLLVFRRLRQNVDAFRSFLDEEAKKLEPPSGPTWSARQLGARVVGRWEDGTPATLSPEGEDPGVSGDPMAINHFAYGGIGTVRVTEGETVRSVPGHASDEQGLRCPHFAHVRKVNPRNLPTDQGDKDKTLTLQMLRRGIPYGPPCSPGREDDDRGLLFLAYQTSFDEQFRVLNNLWMNNPSAPERLAEGHDLLVGQDKPGNARFGSFRDEDGNEWQRISSLSRWVVPTGGAFLFSPSLTFFEQIESAAGNGS